MWCIYVYNYFTEVHFTEVHLGEVNFGEIDEYVEDCAKIVLSEISPPIRSVVEKYISQADV